MSGSEFYLQDEELGRLGFPPGLLQPRYRTHVHTRCRREQKACYQCCFKYFVVFGVVVIGQRHVGV